MSENVSVELRSSRVWVSIAFGLQGLFAAVLLTSLPSTKARLDLSDTEVSLVVLTVLLLAAAGSLLAGWIAPRRGSAAVMIPAYGIQIAALALVILDVPYVALFPIFALFGLGVGLADGGNGMQGLVIQRLYGRPILSSFFAWTTGAALLGALIVSLVAWRDVPYQTSYAVAAVVGVALLWPMRRHLAADPEVALDEGSVKDAVKLPLPWRGIIVFGLVITVVFVGDGVVSAWSSIHLSDTLFAVAWVVPLGYVAYQACVLVSRSIGDFLVRRAGRARVVFVAILVGSAGLFAAALAPEPWMAVVAYGVTGLGLGVILPVSFSAASDLAPERTDEIVARLNLFNYVGVLVGSAATGIIADASSMPVAIAIPAALILTALFAVPSFRSTGPRTTVT